MAIPEQRLASWSGLGAQKGSADTYNSVKTAIAAHNWPAHIGSPKVYLQGSYPNYTNIRGDSDVDVVVETGSTFYTNVTAADLRAAGIPEATFTWFQFRDEVRTALTNYYDTTLVSQGDRCIKVAGAGNRLNADVIPCNEYRRYRNGYVETGITFWTQAYTQIVNYPKQHLSSGASKNASCTSNYKPNIRVFKNARNRAGIDFPSYFVECMLYNVLTNHFKSSHSDTFYEAMAYLCRAKNDGSLSSFECQNGQQLMFGADEHQIQISSAHMLIDRLAVLWDNWQ